MLKWLKNFFSKFIHKYEIPGKYSNIQDMKELILVLLLEKSKLTNKQIGKLIGRNSNSVSRYTSELMRENKIIMFTKPGRVYPYYYRLATPEEEKSPEYTGLKRRTYNGPRSETGKIIKDKIINLLLEFENIDIDTIARKLEINRNVIYNYMCQLMKDDLVIRKYMNGDKQRCYLYMPAPAIAQNQTEIATTKVEQVI